MNQKSQKDFDSRGVSKSFFFLIFDSLERIILFLILIHFDSLPKRTNLIDSFDSQFILIFIHFDLQFNLIFFILIRFDFES